MSAFPIPDLETRRLRLRSFAGRKGGAFELLTSGDDEPDPVEADLPRDDVEDLAVSSDEATPTIDSLVEAVQPQPAIEEPSPRDLVQPELPAIVVQHPLEAVVDAVEAVGVKVVVTEFTFPFCRRRG